MTQYSVFAHFAKKDWDSTAFLQESQQTCCTVSIFFGNMSKSVVLSPSLGPEVTRRPHRFFSGGFLRQNNIFLSGNFFGTVRHFCWFSCKNDVLSQFFVDLIDF